MIRLLPVGVALLGVVGPTPVEAATVQLNPTADVRILSVYPTGNEGTAGVLSVYHDGGGNVQRTLLKFSLAGIPSGQVVRSATLTLQLYPSYRYNPGLPMEIYRAVVPWTENGATWTTAAAGTAWQSAGGDYVGSTGLKDQSPYATNATTIPPAVPLTWDVTALVREWYSGAQPNQGLLLRSYSGNQLHFLSKESGASSAPVLTIEYAPIPVVPTYLSAPGLTNSLFGFWLHGPAGSNFVVQVSADLTNWSSVQTNTIPAEGSVPVLRPRAKNQPWAFYRAVWP